MTVSQPVKHAREASRMSGMSFFIKSVGLVVSVGRARDENVLRANRRAGNFVNGVGFKEILIVAVV